MHFWARISRKIRRKKIKWPTYGNIRGPDIYLKVASTSCIICCFPSSLELSMARFGTSRLAICCRYARESYFILHIRAPWCRKNNCFSDEQQRKCRTKRSLDAWPRLGVRKSNRTHLLFCHLNEQKYSVLTKKKNKKRENNWREFGKLLVDNRLVCFLFRRQKKIWCQ